LLVQCLHSLSASCICTLRLSNHSFRKKPTRVNSEILGGPYRGLSQHKSDIEVTTVINEQLNDLDTLKRHGLLPRYDNVLQSVHLTLLSWT